MTNLYSLNLDDYRQLGDPLADEVYVWLLGNPSNRQIIESLEVNKELDQLAPLVNPLGTLISSILAENADKTTLSQGATFFETYTEVILGMLGLYSLPYCYAGARGVKVLYHSKKIRENPKIRLMETARFVFDACETGAFAPEGRGFVSVLKVRLMHAAVRHFARTYIPDEVPVNQEDLVFTMLSFSLIVFRGLRKTGIEPGDQEIQAYFHLWNYIGKLLGVRNELVPDNLAEASQLERIIAKRQFVYSKEGEALCCSLIQYLENEMLNVPNDQVKDIVYSLMGEEASQCVGLSPKSKLNSQVLLNGMILGNFFKVFSQAHFPFFQRQLSERMNAENVKHVFRIPF